ncbi:MAG: amino acid ABC transporter permease, partial [Micropepsaceae bacterium]
MSQRRPSRLPMPGPIEWLRENLFSTPLNALLTVLALFLIYWIVVPFVQWAVIDAAWSGTTREACLPYENGACWPFIGQRIEQFIYGFYDVASRWRVDLTLAGLGAGLLWLTLPGMPAKRGVGAVMLTLFPLVAFVLLVGGFGLERIPTERWGGLIITLVVAVVGIVASLPLGILLAL